MAAATEALLARIEDASLNASAPPQQRWLDGWLVRTSPGKAQRARSINPVAAGRLPVAQKLAQASQAFRDAGLPMIVRMTPFSLPVGLDQTLHALGWHRDGLTHVLVRTTDFRGLTPKELPACCAWQALDGAAFAAAVGALRGSPPDQQRAHAERLAASPVPYSGFAVRRTVDGTVLCCGQFAREGDLVGLYDVHTDTAARRMGLAHALCERLLLAAASQGATIAYLQVDATNVAALSIYRRLGFEPGYDYHYRHAPAAG
jgi:ribosomal protein S18 acetylase RimI-like enzyme